MSSRSRGTRSTEQVARLIEEFRSSGQSQKAFAESHRIPVSTLGYWLRRHRRKEEAQPAVLPVRVVGAVTSPEPFEIRLGNDRVVRVPADFDADALSRLLAVIEG